MAIHKPGKVLLHHIPLKFVQARVAGGGRKSVDQSIPLVPFIDFLITLVVFLLMSFSASGELMAQRPSITLPQAAHGFALESAPVLSIDAQVVLLDGEQVADTGTLGAEAQVDRIEKLIQELTEKRDVVIQLKGEEAFTGLIIVQADHEIDYRVIKKVMLSAAAAGYGTIAFAVNKGSAAAQ